MFEDTPYILRARHRDDSGDPATEWSDWVTIPFSTGAAGIKNPLFLQDVSDTAAPVWRDLQGNPIDLPAGAPHPMLRVETDTRWQLLRIEGDAGPGNKIINPAPLPLHRAVRVVIKAGDPTFHVFDSDAATCNEIKCGMLKALPAGWHLPAPSAHGFAPASYTPEGGFLSETATHLLRVQLLHFLLVGQLGVRHLRLPVLCDLRRGDVVPLLVGVRVARKHLHELGAGAA